MSTSEPNNRLAGKVAIVTGGGSGFGAAISKRYAEEGCKVIVADLNEDGGQKVASTNSDLMQFLQMDVSKAEDWKKALDFTLKQFGKIDIVVNNAGTSYRNKVSTALLKSFSFCFGRVR